jgi:hypothetical protein
MEDAVTKVTTRTRDGKRAKKRAESEPGGFWYG